MQNQTNLNTKSRSAHDECANADVPAALCRDIRRVLEDRRNELSAEIRKYPPPIPACDQHFNFLLEERGRVAHDISRIDAIAGGNAASDAALDMIAEFLRSCAYLNAAARQSFSARLTGSSH